LPEFVGLSVQNIEFRSLIIVRSGKLFDAVDSFPLKEIVLTCAGEVALLQPFIDTFSIYSILLTKYTRQRASLTQLQIAADLPISFQQLFFDAVKFSHDTEDQPFTVEVITSFSTKSKGKHNSVKQTRFSLAQHDPSRKSLTYRDSVIFKTVTP
jgi:hypothetical protein